MPVQLTTLNKNSVETNQVPDREKKKLTKIRFTAEFLMPLKMGPVLKLHLQSYKAQAQGQIKIVN